MVDMIAVNPLAIETCMKQADFQYPFRDMASFGKGWPRFPVIPALFKKFCELGRPLFPGEAMAYLMENCDPRYRKDERVIRRGQKLYFDSCRELHTWGLLIQCPVLSSVRYQKALDIKMGVDYLAALLSNLKSQDDMIAIQSMMRGSFPPGWTPENDPYSRLKSRRQERRGNAEKWEGPVYYLTNHYRTYNKNIKKCWLFGPQHIYDLSEEIRGSIQDESEDIAIRASYEQGKFDFMD